MLPIYSGISFHTRSEKVVQKTQPQVSILKAEIMTCKYLHSQIVPLGEGLLRTGISSLIY